MFSCCRPRRKREIKAQPSATNGKNKIPESDYTFSASDQTLIKAPNSLPSGYPIFIVDSKNSNFYILDSSRQATLESLENCQVIIGPTESSLFIRDCKNCLVIAYSQQFRARDCSNLNVYLYCSTEPVIETSKNIRFYPNSLKYDALQDQLKIVGLSDKPNKWNSIFDFNDSWPQNYSISNDSCILDTTILSEFNAVLI
jgi:protein XRP2